MPPPDEHGALTANLLTQAYLLEKYGARLNIDQLSEALGMPRGSIYNGLSAGTFTLPTYVDGKRRFADVRDVATYLDKCREKAWPAKR